MRRAGITGLPCRRRPRPKHQTPTVGDLVNRDFTRQAPNQLWVTDITEHPTREGKVYCAVVLDTYSCKVVGWPIDATQTATLVTNALSMAISNRQPVGDDRWPQLPVLPCVVRRRHLYAQQFGVSKEDA